MNLKKLFLTLTFFVLLGTTAFAQQTWYVNNGPTGNDGRNGLSATIPSPDDFVTGPKKTINNAISSANANDVIVVANTGVDYGTGTGEPATLQVTKKLTFQSTGGTVNLATTTKLEIVTGALASTVTFNSGAFNLKGSLLLTSGEVVNSSGLITVTGGTITVAAANTVTKVTGQLLYSGTVNFSYGATYTTANEFPSSGTIGTLVTTAGNLTLKTSTLTINGNITTVGTLNLGGNSVSLTNTGGATTHTFGGNVSNGTLAFSMENNATVNGAFTLPTVSATTTTATARTLDLAGPTAITGTLSVSLKASIASTGNTLVTIGTSGYTGDVITLSGTGTIVPGTGLTTVHGNILLSSTGLNTSSNGQINFTNAATLTINGNITNSAGIVLSGAGVTNAGIITFPNKGVTINGNVLLNGNLSGNSIAATNYTNNGDITFALTVTGNGATTITGSTTNNSTSTAVATVDGGTVSDNLRITFAATTSVTRFDGGITNSSAIPAVDGTFTCTNTGNGVITLAARTLGTVGTTSNRVGTVLNTSVSSVTSNGLINFGVIAGTTGTFYGTSITQGTFGAGGDITFGDHDLNITGNITSTRTATGADITTNNAAGATVTYTIGGYILNSGKSSISLNNSNDDVLAVTGRVENTGTGSVIFTAGGATTGTTSLGGLVASAGNVTFTNHNATLTITGTVNISGTAVVNLSSTGAQTIVMTGNASFTGGTFTTTNRTSITLNSTNITVGGATTNPTFSGEPIIVGNPSPTALVNFVVGAAGPTIAGNLTVNNTTGLTTAVEFSGSTLTVTGKLYFQAGKVNLAGAVNLIVQSNSGTNDFQNTAGYTTADNARVTLNANAPQVGGAGDFGNIEFNLTGGTASVAAGGITITGTIYLTNGPINNTVNNITFNNSTVLPTIVRNSGAFNAVPTFTSNVNVTYIGGDKASGNELPVSPSTKLQNLTVATSIGNVAGKGVVTVGSNSIVNGTINVYANQTLLIDAVTLTMNGAAITLNGDIANEGAGLLSFAAATGTTVTGAGYLPNLSIAAGSTGNIIAGKAIINQLVGTNNQRDTGGDDFDPATTAAQGTITFVSGTNNATFNLTGVAFDGTMAGAVTTAGTGNTMILGGNFVSAGTLTHTAGTINIGAFTYEQRGATVTLGTTANSSWTGSGKLLFFQGDGTTNSAFTLNSTTASTIGVNVELNNTDATGAEDDLIIATAPLTISGTLTITDGELVVNQNLTLTGSAFTIAAAGSESGAGILRLNATTAPLTFTYTGTPSIANLRISNDVNLAGAGTALTVSSSLTHDGGVLNFGSRDLTIEDAFTKSGTSSYAATTGYMIINANGSTWTADQGTSGFSIPNLRFAQSTAHDIALSNAAGRGTVTVTGNLDMLLGAQTLTTNGKLAVANGATVNYTSGAISAAPAYAGTITLVALNVTSGVTIPANIWPSTAGLVTTFTLNSAAGGNTVVLPGSRGVATTLNLTRGTLTLVANTLTLGSGIAINVTDIGSVTKTTGGIAFPSDNLVDITYQSSAGGAIATGIEFPTTLRNLTITRVVANNNANSTTTIGSAATVNGTLTIRNDFTATAQLLVAGNTVIGLDSNTNATAPAVTFTAAAPLVFGGATGQTLTVPAAGQTIGYMRLSMTGLNPVIRLVGGNLTIANTGAIVFANGILDVATNNLQLILPRPNLATQFGGLAFDRSGVTGTNVGHVVGKVSRAGASGDGASGSNGRFEFPVGTLTGQYRPAAITFTPSYVLGNPVSIIVSHEATSPQGTVGLPLNGGNGVTVGNYPAFYWLVSTSPTSVTSTQSFDMDLQANNIGVPYTNDASLRMIRRQDGSAASNSWSMQGTAANYSNYQVVNGTDTTVVVRTVSGQGGLVAQGSRFALGVPSRAPNFTAPVVATFTLAEGATSANTIQFTAVGLNTNDGAVTYSKVNGPTWASVNATTGLVTLTPGYTDAGTATLVIRATTATALTADNTVTITVTNTDRAPVLAASTATVNPLTATAATGVAKTLTYSATDADGDAITYTVAPATRAGMTFVNGTLTFTPAFADVALSPITFTVTASSGTPAMTVSVATVFTVTNTYLKGDVNRSGGVTSADAILVLNYLVNPVTYPLDAEQLWLADCDANGVGNGSVTAYDAASILKKSLPVGGAFLPKTVAAAGTVSFGKFVSEKGAFTLPINVENTMGVTSFSSEIQLGSSVEFTGVNGRLPEGWVMASNFENGTLKIAMAGITPLTDGAVAFVNLSLKDKNAIVSIQGSAVMNDQIGGALNAVQIREIPSEFSLSQNYPNPFNPTTSIKYGISENARVSLVVYNVLGQVVRSLVNADQEAGYYTVRWDGTNDFGSKVSSGIYIYRISAGKFTSTVKMNLLK